MGTHTHQQAELMGKTVKKNYNTRVHKYNPQNKFGRAAAKKEDRSSHHVARAQTMRSIATHGDDACAVRADPTRKCWASRTPLPSPHVVMEELRREPQRRFRDCAASNTWMPGVWGGPGSDGQPSFEAICRKQLDRRGNLARFQGHRQQQ